MEEAPEALDPAVVSSVYESLPVNQIFDGLVGIDPGLHVVPGLATTWVISKDGCTYTFHLRPGVRFHDGSPLTADDVVFTFKRLLDPKRKAQSIALSYLSFVSGASEYAEGKRSDLPGVEAVDPLTVRIRLGRPYLSFLDVLTMDGLRIVPRHVVERVGDAEFGRSPVGTGPFKLRSWDRKALRLTANPDYFGGAPHLDGVDILFPGPDENDFGAGRLRRGEVDLIEVSSEHLAEFSADRRVHVHRFQELTLSFLGLLTGAPPLDDVRVRQAIAHAINRQALVDQAPEVRRAAVGILPPGMPAYSPSLKALPHDPEKARRLLTEAGYPGGRGLRPVKLFKTAKSPSALKLQSMIRSDLAAVGIHLDVVDVPWSELSRKVDEHSAPSFLLAWIADLTDPDSFLRTLFKSGGSTNYFDFFDPKADELLEAGAREMNPVERARIYREAEKRILEQVPLIPLYHTMGILGARREVRGFEPSPLGIAAVNLEKVWLARGKGAS